MSRLYCRGVAFGRRSALVSKKSGAASLSDKHLPKAYWNI
jgi:hypothetical protein